MSNPEANPEASRKEVEQWEYCTLCDNSGYLSAPLKELGKKGWEAFAVVASSGCHTIYLKRKIQ